MADCNIQNFTILSEITEIPQKISKLGNKPYKYEFLNGQKFVALPKLAEKVEFKKFFMNFGVTSLQVPSSPDFLTIHELDDVTTSIAQIKTGHAKKFKNVDDFLKELKE